MIYEKKAQRMSKIDCLNTKEKDFNTKEGKEDSKKEDSALEEESSDLEEESSDLEEKSSDLEEESLEEESSDLEKESSFNLEKESSNSKIYSSNSNKENSNSREKNSTSKKESLDSETECSDLMEESSNSETEVSKKSGLDKELFKCYSDSTSSKSSTSSQNLLDKTTLFLAIPNKPYGLSDNTEQILRLLGENSKNWQHQSNDGLNPLEHAIQFSIVSVVMYLLHFKPPRSIMQQALVRAYCYGHGESLQLILTKDTSLMNNVDIFEDCFKKTTDKIILNQDKKVFYKICKAIANMTKQTQSVNSMFGLNI